MTFYASAPVTGRLCVHCRRPIRHDGFRHWVHCEHGYPCRDYSTMVRRTYAEPPPAPWPPYAGRHW